MTDDSTLASAFFPPVSLKDMLCVEAKKGRKNCFVSHAFSVWIKRINCVWFVVDIIPRFFQRVLFFVWWFWRCCVFYDIVQDQRDYLNGVCAPASFASPAECWRTIAANLVQSAECRFRIRTVLRIFGRDHSPRVEEAYNYNWERLHGSMVRCCH